ncbi:MAG: Type 1 glutamine amidotransferase-like domain-containing protein [Candidatus Saccharimonadales bacterium]
MKLYLTSYRVPVPEELFKLVDKKPEEIKLAIIPNAKDYYSERPRNFKIKQTIESFNSIRLTNHQIVDLRDETRLHLLNTLSEFDIIWCVGGNTFCLMEAIKNSGFDWVIKQLINGGIVYGGESAGAIVAGTTLRGVEFADEPEFVDKVIWEGIGLIDRIIVPHVGSQNYGNGVDELIRLHENNEKLVKLSDHEVLVVEQDKYKVIT